MTAPTRAETIVSGAADVAVLVADPAVFGEVELDADLRERERVPAVPVVHVVSVVDPAHLHTQVHRDG
eukprot:892183-Rhodomonas_salina.1